MDLTGVRKIRLFSYNRIDLWNKKKFSILLDYVILILTNQNLEFYRSHDITFIHSIGHTMLRLHFYHLVILFYYLASEKFGKKILICHNYGHGGSGK